MIIINYNNKAQENIERLLMNYNSIFKDTDPELDEIFHNFAFDECISNSKLDTRRTILVILVSLVANQSISLYKEYLDYAVNYSIDPIEIKELLYQSIAYLGMTKVYDFIEVTNDIFDEKGINLPLAGQSTTTDKNRYEEGLNKQIEYFGSDMIKAMIENAPDNQKHFNDFLSSFCFGDFYTRGGLNNQDRELITFALISSLRGCEKQLLGHTIGNLNVGNTTDDLISVLTVLVPFNGFPRTLMH